MSFPSRLLVAEVLRVADGLLVVARLEVADPVVTAEGLGLLLPQALRLLVVPVVNLLQREDGQLLGLLLLLDGLRDLRSGLGGGLGGGRCLLHLLLRHGRGRGGLGRLGRLDGGDLLGGREDGREDGRLCGRRCGDDLLGLLGLLALLGLVVRLPLRDEGVVGGHVGGADALHGLELVALLRDALKGVGLRRLDVLHEGRPGERAGGGLALGLGLAVLGLRALLAARLAALLADGGGEALVERELLGEGHRLHQRGDLLHGGHLFSLGEG